MADELKTMLSKLRQSRGKKKFFFAYGTGKRTDGNGDGHLAVAARKPKKTDIQEACACQAFFEGFCWSSEDGATVFYQSRGAKLSTALVAKMALTAKRLSGKQYDFAMPSAEEEARGAAADESEDGTPDESEGEDGAPEEAIPAAPPPPPTNGAAPALVRWRARRKGVEPRLLAALKEQRGDGSKMRALFAFAMEKAEAKEYDPALAALDNLDKLLAAAPPANEGENGDFAAFQARLKSLVAAVTKSAAKGQPLAEMKLLVSEAQVSGRKRDFAQAGAVLDRLADLLTAETPVDDADVEARFRKEWTAARGALRVAIENVSDQLEQFASALLEEPDPGRIWIAERGLGELLSGLRDTALQIDKATSKTPDKTKAKAKPPLAELKTQLKSAQVRACDTNQLGVRVTIATTISKAIKRLEGALA